MGPPWEGRLSAHTTCSSYPGPRSLLVGPCLSCPPLSFLMGLEEPLVFRKTKVPSRVTSWKQIIFSIRDLGTWWHVAAGHPVAVGHWVLRCCRVSPPPAPYLASPAASPAVLSFPRAPRQACGGGARGTRRRLPGAGKAPPAPG